MITNQWMRADGIKWKDRKVLGRTSKGLFFEVKWNGMYWVDANAGMDDDKRPSGFNRHVHNITHFYIHDKFNENDIL